MTAPHNAKGPAGRVAPPARAETKTFYSVSNSTITPLGSRYTVERRGEFARVTLPVPLWRLGCPVEEVPVTFLQSVEAPRWSFRLFPEPILSRLDSQILRQHKLWQQVTDLCGPTAASLEDMADLLRALDNAGITVGAWCDFENTTDLADDLLWGCLHG